MGLSGHACATCSRNCFLAHRTEYVGSQMVSSFFKVMYGRKYDKLLFVPPAFSKNIKSLVRSKITFEDSNKRKWDVVLSHVGGSLAFQKGWDYFVSDHDIKMGDLLVFYYFGNSHFLVEIYGRSGCPKKLALERMDKHKTSDSYESTRDSIPLKRSFDSLYEPSAQRRYHSSHAFPGPNIDATTRPKKVRVVKEPSLMTRNSSGRTRIRKSPPTLVPEPEILLDPRSMTSRVKNRHKVAPVADTMVDPWSMSSRDKKRLKVAKIPVEPCSMTSQDKKRPKVIPVAETLEEPCFMTSREDTFAVQDGQNRLFDLSAFEISGKKSIIDLEEETDFLVNESETDANRTGDLHLQESGTSQKVVTRMADKKTIFKGDDVGDYLLDRPENEYTNLRDQGELHGDLHCQECDNYHNVENKAALIDLPNCESPEKNIELSDVDLTIDSVVPLKIVCNQEKSAFSALSGEKMRVNSPETRVHNQDFCGIAEGESSPGASFSNNGQNSKVLDPSSIQLKNIKGGKMRRIQQESRELKYDICANEMVNCSTGGFSSTYGNVAENFEPKVKIEVNDNAIVMFEPAYCDAPSGVAGIVAFSVPPDSKDFLELPEPLPVATSKSRQYYRIKLQQRVLFLRDPCGRSWPVLYHPKDGVKVLTKGWKELMKANNIQPGDECIFTVENSEVGTINVQVVRHE